MSQSLQEYDFALHTCNLSDATKSVTNPFTKEVFRVPDDDGMSDEDVHAIREIFAAYSIKGPIDGGHLVGPVYGNDWITFHPGYDFGGPNPVVAVCAFLAVPDLSDDVSKLIFTLARDGNLALMSTDAKKVRIVGRQPNLREVARWPGATSIRSIKDVRKWLLEEVRGRPVFKDEN
jgi:hypothetical protein